MNQTQTYKIGHKLSSFWAITITDMGTLTVADVERVSHPVSYTPKERNTTSLVNMVLGELRYRGELRFSDNIMLFNLPPNKRKIQHVAYHSDFVRVEVDK